MIPELEAINLPVTDKVEFLLVRLGEKPATNLRFTQEFRHSDRPPVRPDQAPFDALVQWVKRTGLHHAIETRTVNPARELFRGTFGEHLLRQLHAEGKNIDVATEIAEAGEQDTITLYVAIDPTWLDRMRRADHEGDERLMGQCYGFAPTAIEAYITDQVVERADKERFGTDEIRAFAQFRISKTSPEKDLEVAARWAAAVKAASPTLYQQMLG